MGRGCKTAKCNITFCVSLTNAQCNIDAECNITLSVNRTYNVRYVLRFNVIYIVSIKL